MSAARGAADAAGTLPAVLIEAFSDRPCAGNGAAVVLLDAPQPDAWLQALAGSLRQSETAFLLRQGPHWLLRWFTPSCEVPLCGHATLAALLALAHWQRLDPGEPLRLLTRSGPLQARLDPDHPGRGSIDLPSAGLVEAETPTALLELLQRRHGAPPQAFWTSPLGYSVALLDAQAPLTQLGSLASELSGELAMGLVLMQPQPQHQATQDQTPAEVAGRVVDYRLRFFAPGLGIPEDPVTGSAHALVAPWWQARLGRRTVVGWQCSDRPGGVVCEGLPSGTIRLFGSGHLLWDGTLHTLARLESGPSAQLFSPAGDDDPSTGSAGCGWQALLQVA